MENESKNNSMIKFFRHKQKHDVTCLVFNGTARFGKWVWKGNTCIEEYKYKTVTEDFKNAFEEITEYHFNDIWGNNLQKA